MIPLESSYFPTLFSLSVAVLATILTIVSAAVYVQRVRLERPAIGTFNGTDIVVLFGFIIVLPLLYVVMPLTPLLVLLGVTFVSALFIGLRPILGAGPTWLVTGLVIGANIWMGRTLLGTVAGWQLFWLENDLVVIIAAVTTANLYVQGGMRVRHVAWFALVLAVYDAVFTFVWPITNDLAERFLGWPFDPSVGFRIGLYNATIGLGDLLVYALFVIAVLKAYGSRAAWVAAVVSVLFGAVVPATLPILTDIFIDSRTDLIVPAQAAFGPAAYVFYRICQHHYGPERTMAEFLAARAPSRPALDQAPTRHSLSLSTGVQPEVP